MNFLPIIVALAPYIFQLLGLIPGFAKALAQFKEDFAAHPDITPEQKAAALGQARADVDAADDEVQAAVAKDIPPPKPTVPG